MSRHSLDGMEAARLILEFRRLIYMYLIKNTYLNQDDIASEERNNTRSNHNDGNIIINLPTGKNQCQMTHQIKIKIPL